MEKSVAIITARGGSKRIPKKNIKEFCGSPIIAYSIQAALKAAVFDEVMVSTDDMEIAEIARKYGAKVPFLRSDVTSGDYATTAEVVMEVLSCYVEQGREFMYACCLYPTAPFVTDDTIYKAMKMMEQNTPDEVIAVVPFEYPPQRGYQIGSDGFMEYKYKEYIKTRSQDLEKLYHDAGQFYIYNVASLLEKGGCIESGIMPMVMSPLLVQDIDDENDWKLAEMKYRLLMGRGDN